MSAEREILHKNTRIMAQHCVKIWHRSVGGFGRGARASRSMHCRGQFSPTGTCAGPRFLAAKSTLRFASRYKEQGSRDDEMMGA